MKLNSASKTRIRDMALRFIRDDLVIDPINHVVDCWNKAFEIEYAKLGIDMKVEVVKEFSVIESDDEY